MQHKDNKSVKQAYEKPKLRIIELSAEEVLAVGCKTAPGPFGKLPSGGCTNPACSVSIGS
jgi:hypothetical protein